MARDSRAPRPAADGASSSFTHTSCTINIRHGQSTMPRLSEWAGGAGEWTSGRVVDYVSMGCVLVCICVCVCVCVNMYVCSIARRIRSRARNGQMEARRQEWMDCVGKGERHLRFNLAVWREGRGGVVVSLRSERSLVRVPRLSPIWRFPITGRLSDRRREGTYLRAHASD